MVNVVWQIEIVLIPQKYSSQVTIENEKKRRLRSYYYVTLFKTTKRLRSPTAFKTNND